MIALRRLNHTTFSWWIDLWESVSESGHQGLDDVVE
jgi:hypothetical protein